VTETEDW